MAYRADLRHHTLRASDVLPLYDSVFAVAFTLLAFNLPDRLGRLMGSELLLRSVGIYALAALAVVIYWFKLRRLILIDRYLQAPQLALVGAGLVSVVMIPKFASLVLRYGVGAGHLLDWSLPQLVNTLCLAILLLFNLVCVLYARGLRRRRGHFGSNASLLAGVIRTQEFGMLALCLLLLLELAFSWFDNQYIYLLPMILIVEELLVAQRIARL